MIESVIAIFVGILIGILFAFFYFRAKVESMGENLGEGTGQRIFDQRKAELETFLKRSIRLYWSSGRLKARRHSWKTHLQRVGLF